MVGSDPSCITRADKEGSTLEGVEDLIVNDPGMAASIVASGVCVVLTVGVCAVVATGASGIRSYERKREHPDDWLMWAMTDLFVTWTFLSLAAIPAAGAAGKLGSEFDDAALGYGWITQQIAGMASWLGSCIEIE